MKTNRNFFGLGAKLALGLVAVIGSLTSCYEKEDIKTVIDTTPKTVTYTISGTVYNYANLEGINKASVELTKDGNPQITQTKETVNGQFGITLTGLTDADRGDYTLTVKAAGYKTRSSKVTIYFEKADNQTIATHMDFALKSDEIQGEKVEVVAGAEDQEVDITGADENGAQVTDKMVIPAGLLGAGKTQTITLIREGKAEEVANDAVRVYEGKPDGLVFEKPITFTFKAAANKNFKVYYEVGGVWTLANIKDHPEAANVVKNADGTYTAQIWHFSRFKFSETAYEYSVVASTPDNVIGFKKELALAYHNASNETRDFELPVKGTLMGAIYDQPLDKVFAGCPVKEEAIFYLENYLMTKYTSLPGNEYKPVENDKVTLRVPAHNDLMGVEITQDLTKVTYTMTIIGKTYTVIVTNIDRYNFAISKFLSDYTHGAGIGHGQGHGDDLNAGGGIIDFE